MTRPLSCLPVTAAGDRVAFTCNGDIGRRRRVSRRVAPLGAPRAARRRLGEGRLRAAGAVRLLHGARRRRRTRRLRDPGVRVAGRAVTTVEGLDADAARRARGRLRRPRRVAMRLLHPRDRRARRRPHARRRGRPGGSISTGRSPPTCAAARAGRRSTRRSATSATTRRPRRRTQRRRRAPGRARRRGRRSASARRSRSAKAVSPTTARRGTRWSRCRCPPAPRRRRPRRPACSGSWPSRCTRPRTVAAKVQGRRTTADLTLAVGRFPPLPAGGVRLVTGWVEPAYLEPDASWCEPGGIPASPLANGGAFGGKETLGGRRAPPASWPTAPGARCACSSRARTSCGWGPNDHRSRPPRCSTAPSWRCDGVVVGRPRRHLRQPVDWPYRVDESGTWERRVGCRAHRPRRTSAPSGSPNGSSCWRERWPRPGPTGPSSLGDERVARTLLDTCARAASGALAGARVELDEAGTIARVRVRVAAGDPLDDVVLRSYSVGAAHMALGWVLTEGIAVDPDTGEVHDLTIRSFGVIRAKDTPPIDVEIVDDAGPALARSSDAVFAAVAAAAWNALSRVESERVPSGSPPGTRLPRAAPSLGLCRPRSRRPRPPRRAPRSMRMLTTSTHSEATRTR